MEPAGELVPAAAETLSLVVSRSAVLLLLLTPPPPIRTHCTGDVLPEDEEDGGDDGGGGGAGGSADPSELEGVPGVASLPAPGALKAAVAKAFSREASVPGGTLSDMHTGRLR